MRSLEVLKEHKEKAGLSFRKMAKQAGVSEAYWYLIFDNDNPPTLDKAFQIAKGMDMKIDTFLNIVFRDRMLKFLEREGLNEHNSTGEMKKLIEVLRKWNPEEPEKSGLMRYIMSTKDLNKFLTVPDFACMIYGLRRASDLNNKNFLKGLGQKKEGGRGKRASVRVGKSALYLRDFAKVLA